MGISKKTTVFVFCSLLFLGFLAGMVRQKLYYDGKIEELTQKVAALGTANVVSDKRIKELNSATAGDNFNVPGIARLVGAAVVGIKVTYQVKAQASMFGNQVFQQSSQGSGIICDLEGYIITNYHVVESYINSSKAEIQVYLADGRSAAAQYIGDDQSNDLAVIKISLDELPVAQFGVSGELEVGEFVMSIGNPLGMNLSGTVTVGVVSGIDRKVEAENIADSLIQTDAAINPGNSGGPLVNRYGQVIGINTVKIASTEVEGLGFAIPIDYALPLVESIIKYGYVKGRPVTGISGSELNAMTASFYNVPQGLLVTGVERGSAAETAGIRVNDIITAFDGQAVASMAAINNIVKRLKVGDNVAVTYYRQGSTRTVTLVLMERGEGELS